MPGALPRHHNSILYMNIKIRTTLFLLLILAIGTFLRLQELFHTLEYDEVWTLQTFLKQPLSRIFSDFDLPNNHPLNTIAVCLGFFGKECAWTIRLGAFLASLGSIIAGYALARRLAGRAAGLCTAFALAVLPHWVFYGSIARGYSGQTLFLLLTAFFLLKARKSLIFTALSIISGILAAVSLPTSILWLFPLGCIILCRAVKKKNFCDKSLYAIIIIGIFNAVWLLYNLPSYRKGTVFQTVIEKGDHIDHFFSIFSANGFPLWMLIISSILLFRRKLFSTLLFCALFAPLVTIFTTPGPFRVFQPSGICGIILVSAALWQLMQRFAKKYLRYTPAFFIILLIPVYFSTRSAITREPDWKQLGAMLSQLPPSLLPCFRATDGFPAQWNHPKFSDEFIKRLQYNFSQQQCSLLLIGDELSGIGSNGETVILPVPPTARRHVENDLIMYIVNLQQISTLPPGKFAIVLLPVQPSSQLNTNVKHLLNSQSNIIMLNSFMTFPLQVPGQPEPCRYRMLTITPARELPSRPGMKIFIPAS